MNWNDYYMEQAGGGYDVYKGALYQKGYGLGGTFRSLFRWIIPIFKQHALPALKSGAKQIGREAISTASNIAYDALAGKDINESLKNNASTAFENLKNEAISSAPEVVSNIRNAIKEKMAQSGKGIKRKRKKRNMILFKKKSKKLNDIFE